MSRYADQFSSEHKTKTLLPGDFAVRPWTTFCYASAAVVCAAITFALLIAGETTRGLIGLVGTVVWFALAFLRGASRVRVDHQRVQVTGYQGAQVPIRQLDRVSVFKSSRFGWDVAVETHDRRTLKLASGVGKERAEEVARTLAAATRSATA
jgi:hypothetical protein